MTLTASFTDALALVAQGAAVRDREPRPSFPTDAIAALEQAGVLVAGLPFSEQLAVVRDVARADAALARIVDGHLNAIERLAVHGDHLEEALEPGGLLLAVHWRPPTQTYPLRGDEVHAMLAGRPALRGIHAESHDRYRLDVLERT